MAKRSDAEMAREWAEGIERDAQGAVVSHIAKRLSLPAYLVLFMCDLSEFYVYDLVNSNGFWRVDQRTYARWLKAGCPIPITGPNAPFR